MTKEKHHEAHPAKAKPKKEHPREKPHAEEQPYYEEPPEDHPPPPPLPTGQEPQAPAGSRLEEEQKAGHDAVAKAEQEAQHNKPPPHEEGT